MAFDNFAGVEQFEAAVKAGQETWAKAVDAGRTATQKALTDGQDAFVKSFDKAVAMATKPPADASADMRLSFSRQRLQLRIYFHSKGEFESMCLNGRNMHIVDVLNSR